MFRGVVLGSVVTLLLSGADLRGLLDVPACLRALDQGFKAGATAIAAQRVRTDLPGPGTATVLVPGLLQGIPAYTVKVNAKFPDARPALRGVVCLHDADGGDLLALLDSATITAWRTGLAAALATHTLARRHAGDLALIGAGAQADLVLRGLAALRPVNRLLIHDLNPHRAREFVSRHRETCAAEPEIADHVGAALALADIVVCATWSRTPLIDTGDVEAGRTITTLGADEPGKIELSAALLRRGRVIVDDIALALATGALGNAGLTARDAAGTLAQVLTRQIPGRRSDEEITIYAPVGLPWQDLALAWHAYQQARRLGVGVNFTF